MKQHITYLLMALPSLIVITNPLLVTSVFLTYAVNCSPDVQQRIIKRTTMMSFIVMASFAAFGALIFKVFSITIGSFQIAGGIILFTVAMGMLRGGTVKMKGTREEIETAMMKEEVGVVPLAIPMVVGPGSITTVLVLAGEAKNVGHMAILFLSILISVIIIYLTLNRAAKLNRFIGESSIKVMNRLMGLILAAVAAQFVINGIIYVIPEILEGIKK